MAYTESASPYYAVEWTNSASGRCDSLNRLAADQRRTVADHCPVCQGEPGRCLVEVMEEVAAAAQIVDNDSEGRLPL
jgi:hypothetical protein